MTSATSPHLTFSPHFLYLSHRDVFNSTVRPFSSVLQLLPKLLMGYLFQITTSFNPYSILTRSSFDPNSILTRSLLNPHSILT